MVCLPLTLKHRLLKLNPDLKKKSAIVIDSKNNPITVSSLKELFEKLLDAYTSATTEFDIENEKIKKFAKY